MTKSGRKFHMGTVLAIMIASLAAWCFVEIAEEVLEGETRSFDESVLLAFRSPGDANDPVGPSWAEEMARDVTGLGSTVVLAFATVAVACFLWLQRKAHLAAYVALAVATGSIASSILKMGFDRPRPDLVAHGHVVYTSSFPSGHSMMAAVAYLTLGVLLASTESNRTMRIYVMALAVLLTTAVGISRVYLGVHWPTDVLGGWAAGAFWASVCWCVARYLRDRGQIE